MADAPDAAAFAGALHTTFLFAREPEPPVALELVEVQAAPAAAGSPGSFSVVFLGPPGPALDQSTYPVSHPTLGEFPLFIVPTGRDGRGVRYEAIFNRM